MIEVLQDAVLNVTDRNRALKMSMVIDDGERIHTSVEEDAKSFEQGVGGGHLMDRPLVDQIVKARERLIPD